VGKSEADWVSLGENSLVVSPSGLGRQSTDITSKKQLKLRVKKMASHNIS